MRRADQNQFLVTEKTNLVASLHFRLLVASAKVAGCRVLFEAACESGIQRSGQAGLEKSATLVTL